MDNKDTTFLYKYFPLRKDNKDDLLHVRSVLEENILYFSSLEDFNDPFDCCPVYDAPLENFQYWIEQLSENNKYKKTELEKVKNNWQEGRITQSQLIENIKFKIQKAINEELGICCFSEKPDSLLMWGHYASLHTGVCFEFKRTPNMPFFGEALQVRYESDCRPKVNIFKRSQDIATDTFLTKSSSWKYESEYRIIGPNRKPGETHKFPKECLIGIILGARIEQKNEIIVKEIIKDNHAILIKKAKLDDSLYKINIKEY